jgi:hypothetical protein
MNTRTLVVALLATALTTGAFAQDAGPKLYRWVDKDGKVHFDDALPPEAVNQARDEFSAKNGNKVGAVARALTPEERAKLADDQAAAARAATAASEQARMDVVMLSSYETEGELVRAFNDRIGLLKSSLQSAVIGVRSLHNNLVDQLTSASEAELDHRKIISKRADQIAALHRELLKQEAFQTQRQAEYTALNEEFKQALARYRELRSKPPVSTTR